MRRTDGTRQPVRFYRLRVGRGWDIVQRDLRLNARWVDLRVSAQHAVMRVQSAVGTLFREALLEKGFVEIHTPKLIDGESEGGAGVFTTDYFGQTR